MPACFSKASATFVLLLYLDRLPAPVALVRSVHTEPQALVLPAETVHPAAVASGQGVRHGLPPVVELLGVGEHGLILIAVRPQRFPTRTPILILELDGMWLLVAVKVSYDSHRWAASA